jgi:hypothetical protein
MRRLSLLTALVLTLAGGTAALAAPEASAPAQAPDPLLGTWALTVDGAVAGPVASIDGCGLGGEVVNGPAGKKNVTPIAPESCKLQVGANMSKPFYQWVNDSFAGLGRLHNIQLVRVDGGYALNLTNAIMTSVSLPKLDHASKDPAWMTVTIGGDSLRRAPAPLTKVPAPQAFINGLFDVQLGKDRLDLSSLGPWTATARGADTTGSDRLPVRSGPMEIGDLSVRVPDLAAPKLIEPWFQSFLSGNTGDENERPLVLSLTDPTGRVLLQLSLAQTGLSRGDLVPRADGTRSYSLYSEAATLVVR